MAKYRVYLKDGKGIFDVEADRIYEDEGNTEFYVSNNENATALFASELVYAIIDTDKAKRVDDNEPISLGGVVDGENIKFPYIINCTVKEGDTSC